MSRNIRTNTNGVNMTNEELDALIFEETHCDEFGLLEFQNPFVQARYKHSRKEYKLKYKTARILLNRICHISAPP